MRYYPTDLVLTVDHAAAALSGDPDGELNTFLAEAGLSRLAAIFAGGGLARALDELFGGLDQYPWRVLVDTNDVEEFRPIGTLVLDDRRAGNTLRGLLLGWAAGDSVVIRTARRPFWEGLIKLLRQPGFPVPEARMADEREVVPDGVVVHVPDLVPIRPGGPSVEWGDEELFGTAGQANSGDLRIHVDPGRAGEVARAAGSALELDCRSDWVRRLFHRDYLMGTRLSVVRSLDDTRGSGRLDAKLRYVVERARRTAFYRDLPVVDGLADLARLPVLEKTDLDAHSLPAARDMLTDDLPSGEVLRSGGSSGQPRYVVYSRTDWENMVREAVPLFYELGLRAGDRVINTLYGGKMYGGLTTTLSEFARMPVECYTMGQAISVEDLVTLTDIFAPNVLVGQPALIMPLLREAKARRPRLRLQKVIYGGLPMSETDKVWLRGNLGTEVISSILAANDGAQLGYQCGELSGTTHHLCEDYNLIEVVGEDGEPMPDGEPGDLLITSLQKFEGPLIRYRIGDSGRVYHHECGCGVSGKVLEYLGRSDGLIKIMASRSRLGYREVMAALAKFQVSQLQVEIISHGGTETLVMRMESPSSPDPAEVRAHLLEWFELDEDLDDFDNTLDVFDLVVECHAEGGLDRDPVSGKIKPIIDRRLERR
ncbi:phenylacetate--CoA ligase family protein [Amycolatopsis sp. NPDC057786]|uniref:phenylacetate--CoA ligase family protein n=1 Tax=Amycolatopsis sp. NPDC057786 TaxID=3346250 RepID=UPI003671DED3